MPDPLRGEIWLVDLNPTVGHEQAGRRPCVVVSVDLFNQGPAELTAVLPVTSREKGIPFHVEIRPPEGGLKERSFIKCEDIRSVSKERFSERWGEISSKTLAQVEDRLKILLGL